MNEKYKAELVAWGVRSAVVIALAVAAALIQRWVGVAVEAPPPPPVQIVVTPGTEPGAATVTVVSPKP